MWKYLKDKFSHNKRISVERVVSGTGLANVYEFLADEFPNQIEPKVHKEFLQAGDLQGKVVATNAKTCKLCELAMETMMT
jgi:glucokinase